jgi:hypothetical protein
MPSRCENADACAGDLTHSSPPKGHGAVLSMKYHHLGVHHATDAKRRHDAAYARRGADGPVLLHNHPAVGPRHALAAAIVQVQTEQVHGRGEDLHGGRGQELRDGLPAEALLHLGAQAAADDGAEERGHVERGEDGQAVARGEEGVGREGDGTRRAAGSEESGKGLVFEEAEADVGGRRGSELCGSAGNVCRGFVLYGRGDCVNGVGCEVGAAVQHADEGEGFREDEVMRSAEEGNGRRS